MKSGLFTSVPFLVGAAVIIAHQLDRRPHPDAADHARRRAAHRGGHLPAACARSAWIPFVDSLTLVVILTIFPVSFGGTATATNAALCNDLLRSPADSGRAFAFMVLGGNVFGLLAPIVTGYIVQITGSFSSAFVLAGALSLIGAAVSFTLTRHTLGEATPVAVGMVRAAG